MASSNFSGRPFRLEERTWTAAQSAWNTGNNSLIHSELWIIKNSYSPTWAYDSNSYSMYVHGTLVGANPNFGYDFRNSDSLMIHASDNWFGNDGNGYLNFNIDGYCNTLTLGSAEVHASSSTPRISRPSAPPYLLAVDTFTTNSMRVEALAPDNNGSAIDLWRHAAAENSAMTVGLTYVTGGSRINTITGLKPGKQYWVQASVHNANGWTHGPAYGPYQTLAAVYVSNGTSWLPVEVYYSDGSTWRSVEVYYSNGSSWLSPLPN